MGTLFFANKIAAYLESIHAFDFINSASNHDIQKHLKETNGIELDLDEIRTIIDKHPFILLNDGSKARFIRTYCCLFDFYYLRKKEN